MWTDPAYPPMKRLRDPVEAAIEGVLVLADIAPHGVAMYSTIADDGTHRYISPECAHSECGACEKQCRRCPSICLCHCHMDDPKPECAVCCGTPPPGFACNECGAGAPTPEPLSAA